MTATMGYKTRIYHLEGTPIARNVYLPQGSTLPIGWNIIIRNESYGANKNRRVRIRTSGGEYFGGIPTVTTAFPVIGGDTVRYTWYGPDTQWMYDPIESTRLIFSPSKPFTIRAGQGPTAGLSATIQSGFATEGQGGSLSLSASSATSTVAASYTGGQVSITAGTGTGTGDGGLITIRAGESISGTGGHLELKGGLATGGIGGDVKLIPGDGTTDGVVVVYGSMKVGTSNTATGSATLALGTSSVAGGEYSAAFGDNSKALGYASFAANRYSLASGYYSSAFGHTSTASGSSSVVFGNNNTASADNAAAFGNNNSATAANAAAFGISTTASGLSSVAFGTNSQATGSYSAAFGSYTNSSGTSSLAAGNSSTSPGTNSAAFGASTRSQAFNSFAIGRYNVGSGTTNSWVNTEPVFEVGIGANDGARENAMTILKDGKVGIGTTTPAVKFHTHSVGNAIAGKISSDQTTTSLYLADSVSSTFGNYIGSVGDDLRLGSNNLERLRIDSNGNIGIGTTSPGKKLTVVSSTGYDGIKVKAGGTGDGVAGLTIENSDNAGSYTFGVYGSGNGINSNAFYLFDNNTSLARMLIDSSGNVGIGTTSPGKKLDISAGPADGIRLLDSSDSNNVRAYIKNTSPSGHGVLELFDNTETITVSLRSNGGDSYIVNHNFGLGTVTPAQKLDVYGNIAVSGSTIHTSDRRFKKDIRVVDNALEKIRKIQGVEFVWRRDEFPNREFKEGNDFGVIAQNILEVFPELVEEDDNGFYSVAYSKLISPLIEATKELDENLRMYKLMSEGLEVQVKENTRRIASLEEENQNLKVENSNLKERLNKAEEEIRLIKEKLGL